MNTTNHGTIETVKDTGVAAIKGTENVAEATVDSTGQILSTTVKDTVKDTAKVGVDVETATTGLVAGAIKGVKELGVSAEDAAAAVASGALKAVGEVGSAAVDAVRTTVTKPTHSDKDVSEKPELAKAA